MDLLTGIKNIIFDFGGVLIDINFKRVRQAFIDLGLEDFDDHFNKFGQTSLFDRFDKGLISEEAFFGEIQKLMPPATKRSDLIDAWNAMLGDFPEENYRFLMDIRERYNTFLLSNTNETHLRYYFAKLKEWYGIDNMDVFFKKAYYSNRIHRRKPDVETFRYVLQDAGIEAPETLFIDDSPQHVEGALKAGIRGWHLEGSMTVRDLFV